ncbi:hypothetical protein CEXT_299721 [Caerostris extrusa]|uniref:Uncharacterized protein n=1 Tax=Caerostris extrusa TaxID=172846 RepID=A0AAV4PXH3_CAEEX|nr:hypothetical protein CEXT_299721 [Caerostris extrusa]
MQFAHQVKVKWLSRHLHTFSKAGASRSKCNTQATRGRELLFWKTQQTVNCFLKVPSPATILLAKAEKGFFGAKLHHIGHFGSEETSPLATFYHHSIHVFPSLNGTKKKILFGKLSTFESIGHRNRNLGLRFLDNTTTRTNLTFSHLRKELQFVNAPAYFKWLIGKEVISTDSLKDFLR